MFENQPRLSSKRRQFLEAVNSLRFSPGVPLVMFCDLQYDASWAGNTKFDKPQEQGQVVVRLDLPCATFPVTVFALARVRNGIIMLLS